MTKVALLLAACVGLGSALPTESYDFVIVGGGTAGCVLAGRLTESGRHSVLVIQQGGEPRPELDIPGLHINYWYTDPNSTILYGGTSKNRAMTYLVGRVLGGGSSVNGMNWNRGSPHHYDGWASSTGDQGWKYANMLKHFRASENYHGDFPTDQHGYNGPIDITRPKYAPGLDTWLEAGKTLGYDIADPNGPQRVSYGPAEWNKGYGTGKRVGSYHGFVKPFLNTRSNLHVAFNTEATKIEFLGKVASGVRYTVNNNGQVEERFARARKEVIVTAGVIGSPIILQKSGIGPKSVLDAANIRPVKYLPVGENFQDHVYSFLPFVINNSSLVLNATRDLNPDTLQYFNQFGDGPYSSTNGVGGEAFLPSSVAVEEGNPDWPDIHLFHSNSVRVFGITILPGELAPEEVPLGCSILNTRPRGRGRVYLNATNVNGPPVLDFKYLEDERDMQVMIDGIKATLKTYEATSAYKAVGARSYHRRLPACDVDTLEYRSDAYWKCYVEQTFSPGWHAGGTCKMGRWLFDPSAVVDSQLKVLGVVGVRVADASIMPTVTNANTAGAVFAIAEKAADLVLRQWGK